MGEIEPMLVANSTLYSLSQFRWFRTRGPKRFPIFPRKSVCLSVESQVHTPAPTSLRVPPHCILMLAVIQHKISHFPKSLWHLNVFFVMYRRQVCRRTRGSSTLNSCYWVIGHQNRSTPTKAVDYARGPKRHAWTFAINAKTSAVCSNTAFTRLPAWACTDTAFAGHSLGITLKHRALGNSCSTRSYCRTRCCKHTD